MGRAEQVPYKLLREITDDFCEKRIVGQGGFGTVYKGVTKNGDDVAVKILPAQNEKTDLDQRQFRNEFYNLEKLKHNNIVQVLAYCYETEKERMEHNGKTVLVEVIRRALCFEYFHNGSLEKYLSDEFSGLDWHTRYEIIKGTCAGLKYIHMDLEKPLLHLDLKPDNILLDENMVPKIADFGLSMIFSDELTSTTQLGTLGYMPPEYIDSGEISNKFDIFSLGGIIIRIVSGQPKCHDKPAEVVINEVQSNWRKRWQEKGSCGFSLEACEHQVKTCTQIALDCLEEDSKKRPDIVRIIDKLNGIEYDINEPPKPRCETVGGMTMSNEVNLITEHKLVTDQPTGKHEIESGNTQETPLDVGKELIVGREKELEEIVSLLERNPEKFIVFPVYGIGGIGKTTFARLIYNHNKFKCYFKAWVYVSRIFDLSEIRKSINSQLSGKDGLTKTTLIVLDDLWEDEPLKIEDLKEKLCPDDEIKRIVLVTTRSADIAQKICINNEPYKIEPLTDEMCWEIIKEKSDFQPIRDKEKLEAIGKEIAQKCSGVALAAQSLGSMLLSMSYDDWMTVKGSYIWDETISKDNSYNHVLQSLKLSYHFSMDKCLQSCFTYWAFFPKGHEIAKENLIYQWISLGSVTPTKMLSPLQRCEKNIEDLIGLAFLQHSMSPTTYGAYGGHDAVFTMHDLVHDLAIELLDGKVLDQSRPGNTTGSSCLYAWLTDCNKPLDSCMAPPSSLVALRFLDRRGTNLHHAAFELAVSLRVLDLSGCWGIQKLPPSFYELKSLEYVDFRNCINVEGTLESMHRLTKLQYLNLSNCEKFLYLGRWKCRFAFGELRYLNLSDSGCLYNNGRACWEDDFLGSLKLEYLILSSRNELFTTRLPEALGALTELKYLNISFHHRMENLPASFGNLCNLVHLDLSCCYYLQDVPAVLNGLTKLQYLNLYGCSRSGASAIEGLEEVLGKLRELRHLNFGGRYSISEGLLGRICSLTNLEHLILTECYGIYSIPETISNLSKLHTLDLRNCHGQWRLPASISKIDSLKFLYTDRCLLSDTSSSRISPQYDGEITVYESARDVIPASLKISRLENVKSAKQVQAIKLEEKIHIKVLELEWTTDAKRSMGDEEVLRELEPAKDSVHLERFSLIGYKSVSFPSWVMHIDDYLPSLTNICMSDLPKCNKLPPLGQLPNLVILEIKRMDNIKKIDVDLYGGARYFPRLKYFTLDDMKCLEEWNSCLNESVFPCLESVRIICCPRLRFIARLPPCVERLQVHSSDKVLLSSWGNGGSISASAHTRLHGDLSCSSPNFLGGLTKLSVQGSKSSVSLPEWLGDLTSLRKLEISDYKGMKTLPDSIRQLTCLQTLTVRNCESITSLPEWLGDLASLRKLEISDCKSMETLPDSMRQLTCLQTLTVWGCECITSRPEWLGELTSLTAINWIGTHQSTPVGSAGGGAGPGRVEHQPPGAGRVTPLARRSCWPL